MSSALSFRKTMWLLNGWLIREVLVWRGGCHMVPMKDTRDGGQGNCWEVLIFGTYLDSTLAGRLGVGNEGWRNQ